MDKPEEISVPYPSDLYDIVEGMCKLNGTAAAYQELSRDAKLKESLEVDDTQIKSAIWDVQFLDAVNETRKELKQIKPKKEET